LFGSLGRSRAGLVCPGAARFRPRLDYASYRIAGMVRAGQVGAGRARRRGKHVRDASFQDQSGLILRVRSRAWRASQAGMCQIR
jgi:hypothetical protein